MIHSRLGDSRKTFTDHSSRPKFIHYYHHMYSRLMHQVQLIPQDPSLNINDANEQHPMLGLSYEKKTILEST